ncbi:hypothetical protein KAFR_0F01090 [Kazachstania africana CBS 2517]|uniref:UDP-galactose transporter homolog 1 n=1 Tax=Kazachstania africana (strain ATCC 22294 / BCRC 22015 / CBS 2517 / CECT 1963 / NBRC 1671 / NRRL Y-8276) TaxID=1071382 RepID=H2AWF5_KAZAF|nr:hypothetical protein KAFR_0F01090 [Kazachstania africana CBS 2517]CCF58705.1 hypothetical protein KAFR_0F01090 [Kazachstania africana CBS 2517]
MSQNRSVVKLLVCAVGIYTSFLTWALVQEPLTTRIWPNADERFQYPNVIAISQAGMAMLVGYVYLKWKKSTYDPWELIWDYRKELTMISLTQSTSNPLATYSLQYVDYLTYMLAKSCKMIPVLMVHLLLYRTPIETQKKYVSLLVTAGVTIFTVGGSNGKISRSGGQCFSLYGFGMLAASLLLDGLTNATQDKMLKSSRKSNQSDNKKSKLKVVTGTHLMFALNLFIILWNTLYLVIIDTTQYNNATRLLSLDPDILYYLAAYSICGALGQCFIFYTLEQYGSLVLIMITVTRKMMSMVLSIAVYGKAVNLIQWLGIFTVFGGILWESLAKRNAAKKVEFKKD